MGCFGCLVVLLIGSWQERLLIGTLTLLALAAGGDQTYIGIRSMVFAAAYVLLARHVKLNPWLLVAGELAGMVLAALAGGAFELFLIAPSTMMLILALDAFRRHPGHSPRWAYPFVILSAILPLLGSGSRSSLLLWLLGNVRRLSLRRIAGLGALLAVLVPLVLAVPNIPLVGKLQKSVDELGSPVDLDTGAFNQRGVENLMFLTWAATADTREVLMGSTEALFIPHEWLGQETDPRYIPHNQIFGWMFQYGLIGWVVLLIYVVNLYRRFRGDDLCRFFLIAMLIVGFALVGGFISPDFALLACSLNWLRARHLAEQAAGGNDILHRGGGLPVAAVA